MSDSGFSGISAAVIWRMTHRAVKRFVAGRTMAVDLCLFIIRDPRPRSALGMGEMRSGHGEMQFFSP